MNSVIRVLTLAGRKTIHGRRSFLSEAYRCQEVWNNRLNSPVMKNINIEKIYQALDQSLQNNGRTSVVDIDLFANCVLDDNFADELEDIIHKLRLSQYTSSMLPSTHHAVIRAYLEMGKFDSLMRILNDRLNYGIFSDCYCSNLMMDQFLKEKRFREAAKVATFQMLQEDWSHPITSSLGLLSCHSYIINRKSNPWEVEVEEDNEPEEEVQLLEELLRDSDGKHSSEEAVDLLKLLSALPSDDFMRQSSLFDLMKTKVEQAVAENEKSDIENQIDKLKSWEKVREKEVEIKAENLRKELIMQQMNEKKKEIADKEEVLFFFENKDKLDVMIEKNDMLRNQISQRHKKVKKTDEDYIPPEIK